MAKTATQQMVTALEVTRGVYQHFGQSDIAGVLKLLHPEVDWVWYGPEAIPWAGEHRGHDAMKAFFAAIGETVTVEAYEPREFLTGDDGVVTVLGWQRVRVRATGKAWETHFAHVWTVKDGLVTRVREFHDTVPLLEAFRP